jgi:hypothetical protein
MNYEKHYNQLIETRRNRICVPNEYYEKHHIIPKSLGGTDTKDNLIFLTAREHFIAHWLLWRIYKNKQMAFAFYSMVHMGKNQLIKSSSVYEECKLSRRKFIIENNKKYHTNKKISAKQSKLMSDKFKNIPKTKEHREKISNSLKNKSKTDEHKNNLSKSLKNYDWSNHLDRNYKISMSNTGEKNGRAKNVYMFNSENTLLLTFKTMKKALEYINKNKKFSKTTFYRYILNKKYIDEVYFSF